LDLNFVCRDRQSDNTKKKTQNRHCAANHATHQRLTPVLFRTFLLCCARNSSFEVSGCVGFLLSTFNSKAVVEGTEHGLENMVKLSEEAQKTKKNFLGF
jgi:hypothetical protein